VKVAVLGVGLIGGSIGLAAREHGVEVTGFGRDPGRLQRARELGAIDVAADSLAEALDGAEVCFACAPVGALPHQVSAALAAAGEDCVVSDVGSTKAALMAAVGDTRFVGGHPIAGAETAGVEHARADLFEGAIWYLTPHGRSQGLLYERLHRLVRDLGARPVAVDPLTHDRLVATFSHLPHVLSNLLAVQGAERLLGEGEALPHVGPSFRDATRVAGANTAMWADIYRANRLAIVAELREYARRLDVAVDLLERGEGVEGWNDAARAARQALLQAEVPGGVVHELRLIVPNRPGIVASVALALGKAGVNIVDLALAPAADMRSGAMTLWIAGDAEAARADAILAELDL
jgi:prephenate dehydrogenase